MTYAIWLIPICLLVFFLGAFGYPALLQAQEPIFGEDMLEWDKQVWDSMGKRDKWFFVHGFYLGGYAPINAFEDHARRQNNQQLLGITDYFRELYSDPASAMIDQLDDALQEQDRFLWRVPYLIANDTEEQTNAQ